MRMIKNDQAALDRLILPPDEVSQTLQSVLCVTTDKYLVRVLVVLLHARYSIVGPIPFYWPPFFSGHPKYYSTSQVLQYFPITFTCNEANKNCTTTCRLSVSS